VKMGLWVNNTSVMLVGETMEYHTLDGARPVAKSITSLHSNLSSMGHWNPV